MSAWGRHDDAGQWSYRGPWWTGTLFVVALGTFVAVCVYRHPYLSLLEQRYPEDLRVDRRAARLRRPARHLSHARRGDPHRTTARR